MRIVVNRCFGGFSLSEAAYKELGLKWDGVGYAYSDAEKRAAPELIACIKKLGASASGAGADLQIVGIPDDIEWTIEEHAGSEWICEKHHTW